VGASSPGRSDSVRDGRRVRLKLSRAQWTTLGVVWATYGTFYFCRVNVGPARAEIERGVGINALEMGFVLGSLKLGYALGQFVNGQLAERFGPKRVLLGGMIGSIACSLLFAAAPSIAASAPVAAALPSVSSAITSVAGASIGPMAALLMIVWLVNGVAQAGGWPPSVMIMARWFSAEERGRTMGVLGTSYQIGSAITILACGWLASTYAGRWQIVFLVPAAGLAMSALHTWARLTPSPPATSSKSSSTSTSTSTSTSSSPAPRSIASTLTVTLGNPRLWLLALGLFGLDLVRFGFLDWAPTHLKEAHGAGGTTAALKVAVFPLAGAAGALVSGWLTDRFFQSRRAPVIAMMLFLVGILTFVYDRVIPLGALPTIACLALIGFFLYGAQILLVGTAAQDFAKLGTAAAAAGFVDFAGSMGAFAGDVVTGSMVKAQNWRGAIHVWGGAAIVGALLVATLWRAKPHHDSARDSAH